MSTALSPFKEEVQPVEARLEIRSLDPVTDVALFGQMYGWLMEGSQWRRDTEAVFGTLDRDEYLTATHDSHRIDTGVFVGGELIADVIFTLRAKNTYEVHLEAKRGADSAIIITAGCYIRDQIFGWHGAELVYAWVPRLNMAVITILNAIGFQATSVSMLRTTPRGRVTEWVQLNIEANYGQQETVNHPSSEPVLQRHQHLWVDDAA